MEPELQDLLVRIGLSRYAPVFEEEAITDLALLKSIGSSGFVDAMSELALDPYAAEALRDALFGPAATVASDEDELELETNEESDDEGELQLEVNEDGGDEDEDLLLEENAPNAPAPELASAVASTPLVSPGIPASIAVPGSVSVAAGASEQAARYKDEGNQAQQVGRFSEAAALYSKAIACDPREAVFFSNRAAAYVSLRRFGEALADARAAVELKPHWAKAHLRVGGALMGLGRPAEAKVAFEAACRLEPRNAQLRGLADEAGEAVEAEAAGGSEVGSNWVAVLNEEVRHSLFLDEAETATTAGDAGGAARAYGEYAEELNRAMDELREGETSVLSLRSGARGVLVDVDRMAGADGEALLLDGVVRRSGRRVRVRLWHLLTHYDWADAEGAPVEEDAKLAGEMESSAERDRARMERLGAGEGWPGLVKEMAHEVEAVVGVGEERKRYPAVFTQRVEGMPLPEVLDAESGCGGDETDHPPPELLDRELSVVKAVAYTLLLAMRTALSAGLAFDTGGESGPLPAHVCVALPPPGEAGHSSACRVWLTSVEGLKEAPAGSAAASFTAKPLVHSALGGYIRRWWAATGPKLGIDHDGKTSDPKYASVLSRYGTLNWLLFSWEDGALGGDAILSLLTGGGLAVERNPEETETARRRWDAFCQEAFVRLGPRRFDEMKAQVALMNDGQINAKDVIARARYFMCPDNEDMHSALSRLLLG